jgi:hypothetical protein
MAEKTISFKCEYCWTNYTVSEKLQEAVDKQKEIGRCKFCQRKDPNVPTIAEMDGLLTQQDMRDRYLVMIECAGCGKFNQQDISPENRHNRHEPCVKCGGRSYNAKSTISLRTYSPNRKKLTKQQERLEGQKLTW